MKQSSKWLLALLLSLVCIPTSLLAQDESLTLDLTIRPRTELRNGAIRLLDDGQKPALFTINRSRIGLTYTKDIITIRFAAQSIGTWGSQPQVESNGSTMINEAWFSIQMNEFFKLKLGRQQLAYDGDRILGTLDWHPSGRFHDLALVKYKKDKTQFDIGIAYNQNTMSVYNAPYITGGQPYKNMQFLWYKNALAENQDFSLMFLNLGFSPFTTDNYFLQTFGLNYNIKGEKLGFHAEGYMQTGEMSEEEEVNAYMFGARLDYSLSPKNSLSLGIDYLSGADADYTGDKTKSFNPLYGTHHKFYGHMDHFYVASKPELGLNDIFLTWKTKPTKKLAYTLTTHFMSAAGSLDGTDFDQYYGTEVDFAVAYKINDMVNLKCGYSHMFATETLEAYFDLDDPKDIQNWAWVMISVSPKIKLK